MHTHTLVHETTSKWIPNQKRPTTRTPRVTYYLGDSNYIKVRVTLIDHANTHTHTHHDTHTHQLMHHNEKYLGFELWIVIFKLKIIYRCCIIL